LLVAVGAAPKEKFCSDAYGTAREQRCWVHKSANVLNKLPKSVQPRAKQHLQDIWMAETKREAEMRLFAAEVMPRVRQGLAKQAS
jgi:transposase-like protein